MTQMNDSRRNRLQLFIKYRQLGWNCWPRHRARGKTGWSYRYREAVGCRNSGTETHGAQTRSCLQYFELELRGRMPEECIIDTGRPYENHAGDKTRSSASLSGTAVCTTDPLFCLSVTIREIGRCEARRSAVGGYDTSCASPLRLIKRHWRKG